MALTLMYITNDPTVAAVVEDCGVDRIFVDLETLGKEERQGHMNSVKSHHTVEDIKRIRPILKTSRLMVRVNPIHARSAQEIDSVINAGADLLMLPMWKCPEEVAQFVRLVAGRAKTILLLETKEAAECLDEVLAAGGFDEIHIGLNDLHLSYGLDFMFELLANGTVEALCQKIRQHGIPYGFGGIARLEGGLLPAKHVVMEHYRLGSTRAILSRSFCDVTTTPDYQALFQTEMQRLREYEGTLADKTPAEYAQNVQDIQHCVAAIVSRLKEKKAQ